MSAAPDGRLPDFVILGQEAWDQVERRNQLLVRALARRNPAARFLFVERALRPRDLREWSAPRLVRVEVNVWVARVLRPVPDRLGARLSDRIEALQVFHAARTIGLVKPCLWTQDPHAADLLEMLPFKRLVYDLTDDWAAFQGDPALRTGTRARVSTLLAAAEVVFACSPWLCRVAEEAGAQPRYLPNAVDRVTRAISVPDAVTRLPSPRLGYVGTLHPRRIDVALIDAVARLRAGWTIVLIGPDLLDRKDRARLFATPNVVYLGVCTHQEVPSYLGGFEVGLVPHQVTDFTRSLDPLKVYEYLASGLPVISTAAGVAPELSDFVSVVGSADELVERAEELIADNKPARVAARRAIVAGETWDVRAMQVEKALGVRGTATIRPGVTVVVTSFNTRELLRRCLMAVRAQHEPDLVTIVVDNASTDGTRAMLRAEFPEVDVIALEENVGFARANNLAFERCDREFILLLNSDAFLAADAIRGLVGALRRHHDAGVVGPRLVNADGTFQRSAWPFPSPVRLLLEALGVHRLLRMTPYYEDLGTWGHDSERSVDFLIGACLLLRAAALAEVGRFDETFWMYGEEADLQRRLRSRGWTTVFTPEARATHIGAGSADASVPRLKHFYAGQLWFLRKHGGIAAAGLGRVALLAGSLIRGRWRVARIAVSGRAATPTGR